MSQPDELYGRPFKKLPEDVMVKARQYFVEFCMPPDWFENRERYQSSVDDVLSGRMDEMPMVLFSAYTILREKDMVSGIS